MCESSKTDEPPDLFLAIFIVLFAAEAFHIEQDVYHRYVKHDFEKCWLAPKKPGKDGPQPGQLGKKESSTMQESIYYTRK